MFDEEAIPTGGSNEMEDSAQAFATNPPPTGEVGDGTPAFENGVPMPKARPKTGAMSNIANIATAPREDLVSEDNPQGNRMKALVSYLMGADAAPLPEITARSRQVDPTGQMPESERNVLSVAAAGSPEEAWKLVQGHRQAFNAKQAFGYAALNGTPQKPPDIEAAIDAANKAQAHVLDGTDVRFMRSPSGVTATVSGPEGRQQINLSPEQFRAYLNVGGEGQFDKLMQAGVPTALKNLASQGQGQRMARQAPQRPQREQIPGRVETPPQQEEFNKNDVGYSPQLEARAQQIFPWASQSQQREAWLAQQAARESEQGNKLDIAEMQSTGRVKSAEVRGNAQVQAQGLKNEGNKDVQNIKNVGWGRAVDGKLEAAKLHEGGKDRRAGVQQDMEKQKLAIRPILEKQRALQKLTPQEQSLLDQYNANAAGAAGGGPAPQQQQQQAAPQQRPAAASPGQPPEQGAKFYQGKWYRRGPNGEAQLIQ